MSEGTADRELLDGLFCESAKGELWTEFSRHGHVFLMAPKGGEARALDLYEPHRIHSRFAKCLLKAALSLKLPLVGQKRERFEKEGGPLVWLRRSLAIRPLGLLFGNPSQEQRRVICLDDEGRVSKIGFNELARKAIKDEYEVVKKFAKYDGVPSFLEFHEGEDFSLFRMPFYQESGEEDPIELVSQWVGNETIILGDLAREKGHSLSDHLAGLQVARALEHGDLAPWNIRADGEGRSVAIDWEFAGDGVSGVDLAHYYFQVAMKLKRLSTAEAVSFVEQELLACPRLSEWGWEARDLLSYYFATTWNLEDGEHTLYLKYLD